jgi:hypothetical protein
MRRRRFEKTRRGGGGVYKHVALKITYSNVPRELINDASLHFYTEVLAFVL